MFALAVPAYAYNTGKVGTVNTIGVGASFTAAIDTNGSLWTWGDNRFGQLGNGGTGNDTYVYFGENIRQTVPMKIMDDVVSVSCGNTYAAAIKTEGSLWMWGRNNRGQLGNGSTEDALTPVKIMDGVAAVFCGLDLTAVIKNDGSLWMWGRNLQGQLGNGGAGNAVDHLGDTIQTDPIKILDQVAVPAAPAVSTQTGAFLDVAANAYYADAVKWAVEKGVTTGTGDGTTFSPDQICTRGQIVTFLYRLMR